MIRNDRRVMRPVYILLLISITMAALKLWAGYLQSSSALRSVGVNNTADIFYGFALLAGLWMSIQPADSTHPEGHRRFDSLVGTVVGAAVIFSGLYVLFDASWTYYHGQEVVFNYLGLTILTGSMAIKAVFSWYCKRESEKLGSPALMAVSRDQFSDILNDLTVFAALIGVAVGWPILDVLVAVVIGVFILKIGIETISENIKYLTGWTAPEELIEKVRQIAEEDCGFEGPFEIKAHHVGPSIHISLIVRASEARTLGDVHSAEENLLREISELEKVARVYIHVEQV